MRKFDFKNYRDLKGPRVPEIIELCTKVVRLPRP